MPIHASWNFFRHRSPPPNPPGICPGRIRALRPRTAHERGNIGLYGIAPHQLRRAAARPGRNRLAAAQQCLGKGLCHGSCPGLSCTCRKTRLRIHRRLHYAHQRSIPTGHGAARHETATGVRPPCSAGESSPASSRALQHPHSRIRRYRIQIAIAYRRSHGSSARSKPAERSAPICRVVSLQSPTYRTEIAAGFSPTIPQTENPQ